jgi:hypothetical protein
MTDEQDQLETFKTEAGRLLEQAYRHLDNAEHDFTNGSGEELSTLLSRAASRCRPWRLGTLERQLEAAARQVKERCER